MLPKIDVPIYDLKLLSTGKKIRFRPFTVKEEKLFLMATESSDIKSITDTVKQVINNCVLDKIDVDELPIFDLEQIFLQLRSKSIGEVINLKYRCQNDVEDKETKEQKKCNTVVDIDVNISDITPKFDKKVTNKIELTENIGVVMRYPGLNILENYNQEDETNTILVTIANCIDYIYDKESMYYAKDSTKEELVEFVESLQTKDLQKFKDFFESVPKLQKNVQFKCPKCKHEEDILVEGIESFFV
jgi:DNA-directed RNA polymerase subunit M/transcription elongation factor TFIIS